MQHPRQGAGDGLCRANDPSHGGDDLHLHAHQIPKPPPLVLHAHVREVFPEWLAQIDAIQQWLRDRGSW